MLVDVFRDLYRSSIMKDSMHLTEFINAIPGVSKPADYLFEQKLVMLTLFDTEYGLEEFDPLKDRLLAAVLQAFPVLSFQEENGDTVFICRVSEFVFRLLTWLSGPKGYEASYVIEEIHFEGSDDVVVKLFKTAHDFCRYIFDFDTRACRRLFLTTVATLPSNLHVAYAEVLDSFFKDDRAAGSRMITNEIVLKFSNAALLAVSESK